MPVEVASNLDDTGGKSSAVSGPLACENVPCGKIKVKGDAAWNEACRDASTCVAQGSMAYYDPAWPDKHEAAAMVVEDIGTNSATIETKMDNCHALSGPHYTVNHLLATKTATVDKHLASLGVTYLCSQLEIGHEEPSTGQCPCIVGIGLWHALWGVTSALFILHCLFSCLSYLSAGTHYDRLQSDGRSTGAFICI